MEGVVAELHAGPAALEISGDLPPGAGLASSAALCVALALALGADARDPLALARLCSRVEAEWAGAQTGLLDQLACLRGREGHALRLDMRSLEAEPVPLELGGWTLAITRLRRLPPQRRVGLQRAPAGVRARRATCSGVDTLRDAGDDTDSLPEPLRPRACATWPRRTRGWTQRVAALRAGDLAGLGELIDDSHASLRDAYEVSVPGWRGRWRPRVPPEPPAPESRGRLRRRRAGAVPAGCTAARGVARGLAGTGGARLL